LVLDILINNIITRNNKVTLRYEYEDNIFTYIPDFIDNQGNFMEVKGYLFSKKDIAKYNQTKNRVKYF